MKNLPEKELWSSIKNRLGNYSELPDDDDSWDKIAGALPRAGSSWPKRTVGIVLIFITGTLAGYFLHDYVSTEGHGTDIGSLMRESTGSVQHVAEGSDAASNGADQTADHAIPETNNVADETLTPEDLLSMRTTADENSRQEKNVSKHPGNTTINLKRNGTHDTISKKRSSEKSIEKWTLSAFLSETTNEMKSAAMSEREFSNLALLNTANEKSENRSRDVDNVSVPNEQDPEAQKIKRDSSMYFDAGKKKEEREKKKRIFHADVYATLTPSFSFQKISPSGTDDIRVIGLQSEGVMSNQRLGIAFEAGFQRRLSKKLEWYGGLSFYQQRQKLTYEYNSSEMLVKNSDNGGYTLIPVAATKTFDYHMTNVGIMSGVFYHLTGEKLMHKIGGGLQFQKGLLRTGGEGTYDNSRSTYFNYQLSYRLECRLNRNVNVYLQPAFIHAIIAKETLTEPFDIKPYKAGLGIGAIYHF